MKRFVFVLMISMVLCPVFSFDLAWMDNVNQMDTGAILNEIKQLEKSLKDNGNDPEIPAKIAICYQALAQNGQKTASKAILYFEKSLHIKYDPFYQAYLGSAITLKAGEKHDLNLLNKGFKIIDGAYEKDKTNVNIMILRISNAVSKSMPGFVFRNREKIILGDFDVLEGMFKNNTINENLHERVVFLKSLYFLKKEKLKEAIAIWNDIASKYPGTIWASRSRENLAVYDKN